MSFDKKTLKLLRQKKVVSLHFEGCKCVVCTYDYPNKESIIQLNHISRSVPYSEVYLLSRILDALIEMKEQERNYWETWKQAKSKESNHK